MKHLFLGELVAEGSDLQRNPIVFTLKGNERSKRDNTLDTMHPRAAIFSDVQLVGGKTPFEGRLQVKVGGIWGTVCRRGWNIQAAALACQQMGWTLDPRWDMQPI